MDAVVTTILFDGQFWIALIEKTDSLGSLSVGKHIFGAEPTNAELLAFMLGLYCRVPAYRSESRVRVKARKSAREQARATKKSRAIYGELRAKELESRKKSRAERVEADEALRFSLRRERKKEKRRGH